MSMVSVRQFEWLRYEGVQCHAGGVPLHEPVSFELPERGCVLLVGASGLGKTTLLRAALGFSENWTGMIRVNGHALDAVPWRAWRTLAGYVPQKVDVGDGALEAILDELVPDILRTPFARWMERLLLPERLLGRQATELSGGELQRMGLALMLCRSPRLLVLDEPTASLDDDSAEAVLKALLESGMAVLASTHDARLRSITGAQSIELVSAVQGVMP